MPVNTCASCDKPFNDERPMNPPLCPKCGADVQPHGGNARWRAAYKSPRERYHPTTQEEEGHE